MNLPFRKDFEIYLDGADASDILALSKESYIRGFTTNPTLMKKSGVQDYEKFARSLLLDIKNHPISYEVFSDDFSEMERQAEKIASWGKNVFVKIPITNTKKQPCYSLIQNLSKKNIPLNITALFTQEQVMGTLESIHKDVPIIISIFAGRIADTGKDPIPLMKKAVDLSTGFPNVKILWASPREVLNIYQAHDCGCHIITATIDLINKLKFYNKDLSEFSLETVKMFYEDAKKAGFQL